MSANGFPRWERGAMVWGCCVSAIGPACQHQPTFLPDDQVADWLTGSGPGSLSQILEFDHVVSISTSGIVTDARGAAYAPECHEPSIRELGADGGWTLITAGLTGQHGYRGPWLHDSEVIEGGVARRILEHVADHGGVGFYVAVYATWDCEDCGGAGLVTDEAGNEVPCPAECEPGDTTSESWAIAYLPEPGTEARYAMTIQTGDVVILRGDEAATVTGKQAHGSTIELTFDTMAADEPPVTYRTDDTLIVRVTEVAA